MLEALSHGVQARQRNRKTLPAFSGELFRSGTLRMRWLTGQKEEFE